MIGLFCDETQGTIAKYDNGDDERDNEVNEDVNGNYNDDSGSGYAGLIFNPVTTPQSHGGVLVNNGYVAVAAYHYVYTSRAIYLHYKDPIKDVP